MSISNLSSQYISGSFPNLVQYSSSGDLYDGSGTQINNISVPGNINIGGNSLPSAAYSLAAGRENVIVGAVTGFALGKSLVVSGSNQTVVGFYNKQSDAASPFIVGAGTGPSVSDRADAFKVTTSGSIVLPINIQVATKPVWTGTPGELVFTLNGLYIWTFGATDWALIAGV